MKLFSLFAKAFFLIVVASIVLAAIPYFTDIKAETISSFVDEYSTWVIAGGFMTHYIYTKNVFSYIYGLKKIPYTMICSIENANSEKVDFTPVYMFEGSTLDEAEDREALLYLLKTDSLDIFDTHFKAITMQIRPSLSSFYNSFKPFKVPAYLVR